MTKTMQDEFEAEYCEHAHRLPALVKNCRLSNGSYGDPCIAKAWHWFRRSREMLVVELPAGGYFAGYDNEHMMESRNVREAIEAAGLKVKP